eukprot:TRINITY_DN16785_c0_g1_i1.p1 TRINITY_DN16785_c0_g1~~TRINITY_DN16785_c0_g1_i1.p1  ORF type:complete len:101 (+),score=7.91 TRINITY_DN16785_c0_g1_i1:120-422(+)
MDLQNIYSTMKYIIQCWNRSHMVTVNKVYLDKYDRTKVSKISDEIKMLEDQMKSVKQRFGKLLNVRDELIMNPINIFQRYREIKIHIDDWNWKSVERKLS